DEFIRSRQLRGCLMDWRFDNKIRADAGLLSPSTMELYGRVIRALAYDNMASYPGLVQEIDAGPSGKPEEARLKLDPLTQTATLDGTPYKIEDPKAFAVYHEIVKSLPLPITKRAISARIPGTKGPKKIRSLLTSLADPIRQTVQWGPNGY